MRNFLAVLCLLSTAPLRAWDAKNSSPSSFPYAVAQAHERKPHRRTIPIAGVDPGFNQLRITLTVSPAGEVTNAKASGEASLLKLWPELQAEVRQWKFVPFEKNGQPVTAEVEEYLDVVPPERFPQRHRFAPTPGPNSQITITLDEQDVSAAALRIQ